MPGIVWSAPVILIDIDVIAATPTHRAGLASLLSGAYLHVAGQHARWDDLPDAPTSVVLWLSPAPFAPPTAQVPARPCVLLCDDARAAVWLQRAGLTAWALLPADAPAEVMRAAVHAVHQGLIVIDPRFATQTLAPIGALALPDDISLTPREVAVLELISHGLPNKAIASQLQISDSTVKFHLQSAFGKLGASSRAEAVSSAARRGLITL